ncbi:MAG: hypothetical protein FWH41_02595 [Treponema sp.]|nr:hypothetical protein [Treponema sp.]
MFGTYFKSSIKSLPVIVLFPLLSFLVYLFFVDGYLLTERIIYITIKGFESGKSGWGLGCHWMLWNMVFAVVINFLHIMIIPSAIGGINAGTKQAQFYLGFFTNLVLLFIIPIIFYIKYKVDLSLFFIVIALDIIGFLLPFILGSRFVAAAYKKAFWFVH